MNTGLAVMENNLQSWSWHDITSIYRILGRQLKEYAGYKQRCHIPDSINIDYPDNENVFVLWFQRDVQRLDEQVAALDQEISRRNNLIGVLG